MPNSLRSSDLKISPFNPIETNQTATRAPSISRFAPNFTQILIRLYHTMMKMYVIIRQHFVKICKIINFQHNMQEFVILYFGQFIDYQNSFDNFWSRGPRASGHAAVYACCCRGMLVKACDYVTHCSSRNTQPL